MPPTSVKLDVLDRRARSVVPVQAWIAIAVALAFGAIALIAPALKPGPFVPQVTMVNHGDYAFGVAVTTTFRNDPMLLGTATAHASTSIDTVYDQGSTWTFRFTTQNRAVGEVVLSRAALSAAGWRIVIPDHFSTSLRIEGVVPTS